MSTSFDGKVKVNLRDVPTYSVAEASCYLDIPAGTIRSWVYGRSYYTKLESRRFEPLIKLSRFAPRQLSFTNLVEAHVLRSIRKIHNVSMEKVRAALIFVERSLEYKNPLARAEFKTDGVDLFIESLGKLIVASEPTKAILHKSLMVHLERVEIADDNLAQKLFPFNSKVYTSLELQPPRTVVIDPRISFGRLVLVGTGIPTHILAERYKFGETIQELADDYKCDPLQIEDAIRWELPVLA